VNWDRYCKVEKKMQAAIDSGNEATVKEIVDEWDFADNDACLVLGRKFLAGELKPPPKPATETNKPPPKPSEAKPAETKEDESEYSDDHEEDDHKSESPRSSGQVSVKSQANDEFEDESSAHSEDS